MSSTNRKVPGKITAKYDIWQDQNIPPFFTLYCNVYYSVYSIHAIFYLESGSRSIGDIALNFSRCMTFSICRPKKAMHFEKCTLRDSDTACTLQTHFRTEKKGGLLLRRVVLNFPCLGSWVISLKSEIMWKGKIF